METGRLRGRDHAWIGGLATLAAGRAAIALSRGGAPKRYPHKHPNEDAAGFAEGPGGALLAVADGHWGCEAAERAIDVLLDRFAPDWTAERPRGLGDDWTRVAADALLALNGSIHAALAEGAIEWPRTTLALALARPGDALLAFASIGDSHVFRAGGDALEELTAGGERAGVFLGDSDELVRTGGRAQARALGDTRALVLATDGLSERGIGVADPAAAVAACTAEARRAEPHLRPLRLARALAERALDAQREQDSGDNVACAAWIAGC